MPRSHTTVALKTIVDSKKLALTQKVNKVMIPPRADEETKKNLASK